MTGPKRKLAYVITEDWFFCSHFLARAVAANEAGYDVCVIARFSRCVETIRDKGLRTIELSFERASFNPWVAIKTVWRLCKLYRNENFDVVHHVALKPIIYGTLAARWARLPRIVNAVVGLGYAFSSQDLTASILRPLLVVLYRWLLSTRGCVLVLENGDDAEMFANDNIVERSRVRLIRGAGVDIERFAPAPEVDGLPVVVLAARMLRDKGVYEFVAAARQLKRKGVDARFVLVGDLDADNPASISRNTLSGWRGVVEWQGYRENMAKVFAECHIVCLPSYREGLPKVLLEAAAAGKPLVATDVPGCREIVRHRVNGIRVPPRDSQALAQAISELLENKELRAAYGRSGRAIVCAEFDTKKIERETLQLYRDMFSPRA